MKWDRERVEPAEFIFPAATIRERDINGLVIRETVRKGIPALSAHKIELIDPSGRWEAVVADVGRISSGWSFKHLGDNGKWVFTFRLTKAKALAMLVAYADQMVPA